MAWAELRAVRAERAGATDSAGCQAEGTRPRANHAAAQGLQDERSSLDIPFCVICCGGFMLEPGQNSRLLIGSAVRASRD